MKLPFRLVTLMLFLGYLCGAMTAHCQDGPPSYAVQYLGTGSVVAVNNVNTVVGVRTDPATGVQTPLVSAAGGAWLPLSLPAGASGAFPTDINDRDTIVGVANMTSGRRAVRWFPTDAGYAVEVLPLLPGELASYATGINNLDQIVGARAGILGTPYGFGWMYTEADGLVDLNASYGWFATPDDISDAGVILSGTQTFDLASGTLTDVGLNGPSNYNAIGGKDINNSGQIIGEGILRSSSLNIISVFRYLPGTGWEYISGTSRYTVANDINNHGDLCWSEQGAGIYFNGLGGYALGNLLDPAAAAAGWVVTGYGCMVNDQRVVATAGRNTLSGQSGAVLLTPVGLLPPPAAPIGLIATPHPATSSEPFMSINLSWINGDTQLTGTYELERRVFGQTVWTTVKLVPPAMSTLHQDTTVAPGTTYDYRVRAVGVAGPGPWSATATATAPATPLDVTQPVVLIVTPANGATVSGIVSIAAQASDNVGVELLEIGFWNQYTGQNVILGTVANSGNLTVNWDTRGLTPAAYTVWASANDAIGNWTKKEISVNVTAPARSMKVTSISLNGWILGKSATVFGNVYVRDSLGQSVASASVTARWILPNGSTKTATAMTDSSGRARFAVSGSRGTYTLTVTGVAKTGYTFDTSGSVIFRSITK